MRLVSPDEARRIAVRSQLLDGSAGGVHDTVRRLGRLQLDPIATVAPAQHLVLWSRLGGYDTAELDRLLWDERALFEWNAYIYPLETLPLIRALMRRRRGRNSGERWGSEFLRTNPRFKRYVLTMLEENGPMLSRDLQDLSRIKAEEGRRWYGTRNVSIMLEILHARGMVAVAGRLRGQRLWDLAERCLPPTEPVRLEQAERTLADQRFRSLGVRLTRKGWEAHPDAADGVVPDRVVLLSPFDRLIQDRARAEALFDFFYRLEMFVPEAKREYGYYVLPILFGDRVIGRIEPVFERKTGVLTVRAAWSQPGAPAGAGAGIATALRELAAWLGAHEIRVERKLPRAWAPALRELARP
jgi:uncharacterized protein YcaQ